MFYNIVLNSFAAENPENKSVLKKFSDSVRAILKAIGEHIPHKDKITLEETIKRFDEAFKAAERNASGADVDNFAESGIIKAEQGKGVDMLVDKFTPCLEDAKTGKILSTSFALTSKDELKKLKGWKFNWTDPSLDSADIYKLTLQDDTEVQGLIAITKFDRDKAMYVNIVESAPHNLGENKRFNGVGGHLYAIAVQKSLENGYGGFVFMDAKKRELVEHYRKTLGATLLGHPREYRMFIDEDNSQKLIKIYTIKED